jgi:uncharacterized membrane protein YphA (DoxX/SURF4 family)
MKATHDSISRTRLIFYWITTILAAVQLGSGGIADIVLPSAVLEGMAHLGYPKYFCVLLGIWKVLAAITILVPGFPRLKEWAYAGAFFELTGAVFSHIAVGDPAVKLIGPVICTGLLVASWALRPSSRRIPLPAF